MERVDCIVIGAGPGGLQASIYLGRYNFRVILFHTPGGRTGHAKHIENYLGLRAVSGQELLKTGLAQAENFGIAIENATLYRGPLRAKLELLQLTPRPRGFPDSLDGHTQHVEVHRLGQ